MLRVAAILAVLCVVTGCANNLKITYRSDPPGAVLYQGERVIGYTPRTLTYNVSEEQAKRGSFRAAGTRVVWASGASAQVPYLDANLNQNGYRQEFLFQRPNVPGRADDMRFALELERNRIMKAQAEAQADQAYWQMYNAIQQQNRANRPTNCSSSVFGNTINTTCY
jgi:hypothetical protein